MTQKHSQHCTTKMPTLMVARHNRDEYLLCTAVGSGCNEGAHACMSARAQPSNQQVVVHLKKCSIVPMKTLTSHRCTSLNMFRCLRSVQMRKQRTTWRGHTSGALDVGGCACGRGRGGGEGGCMVARCGPHLVLTFERPWLCQHALWAGWFFAPAFPSLLATPSSLLAASARLVGIRQRVARARLFVRWRLQKRWQAQNMTVSMQVGGVNGFGKGKAVARGG
jgi:hypothetical protein